MKTIDFIIEYLRDESTLEERKKVAEYINIYYQKWTPPILDPEIVLDRLIQRCKDMRRNDPITGQLGIIKHIKDVTGWGLKSCKDWFDNIIDKQ